MQSTCKHNNILQCLNIFNLFVSVGRAATSDLWWHLYHGAPSTVGNVCRVSRAGPPAASAVGWRHAAVSAHRLHFTPGGT